MKAIEIMNIQPFTARPEDTFHYFNNQGTPYIFFFLLCFCPDFLDLRNTPYRFLKTGLRNNITKKRLLSMLHVILAIPFRMC